ncbi:MAG TPA: porphobilinogen synthase [Candidatus Dormibacteraeota bacterium]|nr:porphobilinogen synthase [Candidatus Dormibacteraeota bacterium]
MKIVDAPGEQIAVTPPYARPRRLRRTAALRAMVRETQVRIDGLVQPLFVVPGSGVRQEISSMPGIRRYSTDTVVDEVRRLAQLGLRSVLLFGVPDHKDEDATSNYDPNGVVQRATEAIKRGVPDVTVIADLCNCEYTSHGHCGILKGETVDNDATLELLARVALSYARAGVDVVAPSDMMDGRVRVIRENLDAHDFEEISIMAYSAKFASAFYGPFREAAESTPSFGDRRSYQMDPANRREALREAALDVEEGADVIMVKPGLPYLDILRELRDAFEQPVAVYNVSGEYSMLKAAAMRGWIEEERAIDETLTAFARAGADITITYFAAEYAARAAKR